MYVHTFVIHEFGIFSEKQLWLPYVLNFKVKRLLHITRILWCSASYVIVQEIKRPENKLHCNKHLNCSESSDKYQHTKKLETVINFFLSPCSLCSIHWSVFINTKNSPLPPLYVFHRIVIMISN
jgi:hypothetical protein